MADDSITQGSVGVLGSSFYICDKHAFKGLKGLFLGPLKNLENKKNDFKDLEEFSISRGSNIARLSV